jgi:hypothetical protein
MQSSVLINKSDNNYNTNTQYGSTVPALLIGLSLLSSIPSDMLSAFEKNSSSSKPITEKINIDDDNKISALKEYYGIKDKTEIIDFLLWINQPIADIFGSINKSLHLFKCWDEEDYHLVLNIFSELDDMDEISDKENKLFQYISENKKGNFLDYVVIAQC